MIGTFRRSDAEKIESLVRIVGKWRMKAGLTIPEVLTAICYADSTKGGERFEEDCAEAELAVAQYYGYMNAGEENEL